MSDESDALLRWRVSTFERLARIAFVVVTAGILFQIPAELSGANELHSIFLLPAWLLVGAGMWLPNASAVVRHVLVLGGGVVGVGANLFAVGFLLPNGFVAAAMLALLAALFLPRRLAWLVWVAIVIAPLIAGYAFVAGWQHPTGDIFDLRRPANWLRVLVMYGGISAAAMAGLLALMRRLRDAEHQSRQVLQALEQESAQRLASLSEQRSLEAQLRECQRGEAVGVLAGSVAHDFNNLLTVTLACSEELCEELRDPQLQQAARDIHIAGMRAAELTSELLLFSRSQTARRVMVCTSDALRATTRLLERTLPPGVRLDVDLEAELPTIETPAACVEQVLLNLCVNACDAMPRGGSLRVSGRVQRAQAPGSSTARDYVCIEVVDTGVGMDPQIQERAFEPLFSTKDTAQHPGLGLAVVQRMLKECGGFVSLCSTQGKGTEIETYWPIMDAASCNELQRVI